MYNQQYGYEYLQGRSDAYGGYTENTDQNYGYLSEPEIEQSDNYGYYNQSDYNQSIDHSHGVDSSYSGMNESIPGMCQAGMDSASWGGVAAGAGLSALMFPPLAPVAGVVGSVATIASWLHRATHNYRDSNGDVVQHDGNGNPVKKKSGTGITWTSKFL